MIISGGKAVGEKREDSYFKWRITVLSLFKAKEKPII